MNIRTEIRKIFLELALARKKKYYSSHGHTMSFREFVETEVEDRGNYKLEQVQKWKKKYGLSDNDRVIWVSPLKWVANRYNLPAEMWSYEEYLKSIPENEMHVFEFDDSQGFIIPESDDGDHGFLFVLGKKPIIQEKRKREKRRKKQYGMSYPMGRTYYPVFGGWWAGYGSSDFGGEAGVDVGGGDGAE